MLRLVNVLHTSYLSLKTDFLPGTVVKHCCMFQLNRPASVETSDFDLKKLIKAKIMKYSFREMISCDDFISALLKIESARDNGGSFSTYLYLSCVSVWL